MGEARRSGLAAGLRALLDTGLAIAQTRLELLAVEAQEEKLRVSRLLLNVVLAALLLGAGAVFLAIFLTVLLWDDHRLLALGAATVALLAAGLYTASNAAAESRRGSRLFSASLAELARDRDAIGAKE